MRAVLAVLALAACEPLPPAQVPGPARPMPVAAGARDPINRRDVHWLHAEAERVMRELIGALDDNQRTFVDGVTLSHDDFFGIVNAFAGCEGDDPAIAVTDEMLDILARLAAARAMEERFDVAATDAYMDWAAHHHRAPPEGREDPAMWNDRDKLALQRTIYDEEVAWVVGHELAHHYLRHLRCGQEPGIVDSLRDVAQQLVPAFKQVDELAADAAGIDNVLATARRTGRPWSERGARLVLELFARQEHVRLEDLPYAFVMTHPLSSLRLPALRAVVAAWHVTDGNLPIIPVPHV